MSKWDEIVKRDSLEALPCVADLSGAIWWEHHCEQVPPNPCPIADACALRPIYEEYMAMRAVVEAYLNNLTHEESVEEAVVTMRVAGHGELAEAWGELV